MNGKPSPFSGASSSQETSKIQARLFPSYRLAISVLSFCGLFLSALSQSSMGAVLVCMVTNGTHNATFGMTPVTFDWDKATQGWILGTRFLAYYLAQLPSGYLTSYISCKMMATIGLVVMGTFDILAVPCAQHSTALLHVARITQGVGNVFATTGCYGILGKWVPSHESSSLVGFAGMGFFAGSFPLFLISSIVCESSLLGWPSVFYISGGLSLFFSVLWHAFADNEPAISRWISREEKDYVMACKKDEVVCRKIPWRAMLTSGPIYGVACAQFALEWLLYFSLTVAPGFFTDILHLSRGQADIVCGVPFILGVLVSSLFGRFLDIIRERGLLSTVGIRRLAEGVGSLIPAICCLALALLPESESIAAVAVYLLCVASFSCTTSGWVANVFDLAPQQAGAAFTVCQTLATWVSFAVPVIVENLTAQNTKEQWNTVFYIAMSVQVACFVGFCMLASGEVQPWAKPGEEEGTLPNNIEIAPLNAHWKQMDVLETHG